MKLLHPRSHPRLLPTLLLAAIQAVATSVGYAAPEETVNEPPTPPIPITFSLEKPGYVSLVIDNQVGRRVRNLLSGDYFEAGEHTVPWDGFGEGKALFVRGAVGYTIQRNVVDPGEYQVRGIVRDKINLTYEFSVYPNVKGTPWVTNSGKKEGGWLADHGNVHAALFIPSERSPDGVDTMLLASSVAEAGDGMAWTDLEGNKIAGQRRLGGAWTAASHLAYDGGENVHPEIYAYGRMDWMSKTEGMDEMRITGFSKGRMDLKGDDLRMVWKDLTYKWNGGHPGAMAVHNNILVFSVFGPGRIFFYDTSGVTAKEQAEELAEIQVDEPNALAFDLQGRLLVVDGTTLLRYTLQPFPNPLGEPGVLISEGLDAPRYMTVDCEGQIYIAEWGQSHQVKVFSPEGKWIRSIGHPGGPVTGPFDPERMNFPYGLSIDSEGKLWVGSRRWWLPKVIWVWDKDGHHVRNHYGPTQYGGGGYFDPEDRTRMLYHNGHGGIEFQVDWEKGTGVPDSIYQLNYGARNDRWFEETLLLKFRQGDPAFPYRAKGHRYISNSYTGMATGPKKVYLLKDHTPEESPALMLFGTAGDYEAQLKKLGLWDDIPGVNASHPGERFNAAQKTLCLWLDRNGDGTPQADEFQIHLPDLFYEITPKGPKYGNKTGIIKNIELGRDLDILVRYDSRSETEPGGVLRFRPVEVQADGLPIYDLTQFEKIIEAPYNQKSAGTNVHQFRDGRYLLTGGPIVGYSPEGEEQWIYHSEWPSLHAGHASPQSPQFSGQVIATTRMIGDSFTPPEGDAGPLWAINGNRGLIYLFTADGFLVDTLFNYRNQGRLWNFPEHDRGMDVTDANLGDETFNPTLVQFDDGGVYLNAGKTSSSITKVNGLESIQRFDAAPVSITIDDLNKIKQYNLDLAAWERSKEGSSELRIPKASPITIDGEVEEWIYPQWVTVQEERFGAGFGGRDVVYTQAALSYDDENLYVVLRSRGRNVLKNEGGSIHELFTTGGALDIHLASWDPSSGRKNPVEGDVRLLIAQVGKEIKAFRFRPVVPGTKEPIEYYSTVVQTTIDQVDDVSDQIQVGTGKIQITERKKTVSLEQIEFAIPLAVLGWNPKELPETIGDIGILAGDGGKTVSRLYWHNKATGIVSDIPSEAKLQPSMWGTWKVSP